MGGKATPPPVNCDTLPEPTRARPVPFWRHCLAVGAGHLAAGLGCGGALAVTGQLGRHDLMKETDVDLVGHEGVSQLVAADHRAVLVDSVDRWHRPNL